MFYSGFQLPWDTLGQLQGVRDTPDNSRRLEDDLGLSTLKAVEPVLEELSKRVTSPFRRHLQK